MGKWSINARYFVISITGRRVSVKSQSLGLGFLSHHRSCSAKGKWFHMGLSLLIVIPVKIPLWSMDESIFSL